MEEIGDPKIVSRIKRYLDGNRNKKFIDIERMASVLRWDYPAYQRMEQSQFRIEVDSAFKSIRKEGRTLEGNILKNPQFISAQTWPSSGGSSTGDFNFRILFVESPVKYWVRIQDPARNRKDMSLVFKMDQHYSRESNIVVLKVGEIDIGKTVVCRCTMSGSTMSDVVYPCGDGVYRRAKVLNKVYDKTRTEHRLHKIELFLLDEGRKDYVDPGDVIQLPPGLGLEDFPPAAAEVVVAGLSPRDTDSDWSVRAKTFVHNKLSPLSDNHDVFCRGRVLYARFNTFWINRCELMVRQLNIYVCVFEARGWLLENGHAVENPDNMEMKKEITTEDEADAGSST